MKQLSKLMKQAQQMQSDMQKMQEELSQTVVAGEAGGGMVRIQMTCRFEVRRVQLEDELLGEDREMLEDLIAAALNDAVRKVEETTRERMSGMTGGLNIPGLNLPL